MTNRIVCTVIYTISTHPCSSHPSELQAITATGPATKLKLGCKQGASQSEATIRRLKAHYVLQLTYNLSTQKAVPRKQQVIACAVKGHTCSFKARHARRMCYIFGTSGQVNKATLNRILIETPAQTRLVTSLHQKNEDGMRWYLYTQIQQA